MNTQASITCTRNLRSSIRQRLIVFIFFLSVSGLTAFPIETQLRFGYQWFAFQQWNSPLTEWIATVYQGVSETNERYPFIAYGTDWLAFAHLVIALAFVGPLRDPVRNKWVVQFGVFASVTVIPMALIAGEVRQIPYFWRLIDCSFGIVAGILLSDCLRRITLLERLTKQTCESDNG